MVPQGPTRCLRPDAGSVPQSAPKGRGAGEEGRMAWPSRGGGHRRLAERGRLGSLLGSPPAGQDGCFVGSGIRLGLAVPWGVSAH